MNKIEVSVHPNQVVLVWDNDQNSIISAITFKETNRIVDITKQVIDIVEDSLSATDGKINESVLLNGGLLEDSKSIEIDVDEDGERCLRNIELTIMGSTLV